MSISRARRCPVQSADRVIFHSRGWGSMSLARDGRVRTGLMVFSLFPPATVSDPIVMTKAEAAFGIHPVGV
jgi:hypothetical protein